MNTRQRIIDAATRLLEDESGERVSTRDICDAAGVTAPTLYHHFGDKEGLYDAVAAQGFDTYVAAKRSLAHTDDAVADLQEAWVAHVGFGVAHPVLYTLMYGGSRARLTSPGAQEARVVLIELLTRIDRAGLLRTDVESATSIVEAACVGATLQAIRDGDVEHVGRAVRDAIIDSLVVRRVQHFERSPMRRAAKKLLASIETGEEALMPLQPVEFRLLEHWLRVIAGVDQRSGLGNGP